MLPLICRRLLSQTPQRSSITSEAGPNIPRARSRPFAVVNSRAGAFTTPFLQPRTEPAEHNFKISSHPSQWSNRVPVKIGDRSFDFDAAFLRDSCSCGRCRDPDSKQKLFQTSDIPVDIAGHCRAQVTSEQESDVVIEWSTEVEGFPADHCTRLPMSWLKKCSPTYNGGIRPDNPLLERREVWDRAKITEKNKWVNFEDWVAIGSDEVLLDALEHLHLYGLIFLHNVPSSEESVVTIANRIGVLKETFYGRTWDVRSKPNAENIAYTPQFLGLHMDLLYTTNPPHLQLLHSLRARTPGGESFFSDAYHAAEVLRRQAPEYFEVLQRFPVTYHYHHKEHHYHYVRPTIEVSSLDGNLPQVTRVNWSPPFQGHFDQIEVTETGPLLTSYVAAAHAFETLLSSESSIFEYRLEEGECVIFDNRRVLHARRAFDPSKGERWLKGAYVEDDVFYSKLRTMREAAVK